MERPNPDTLGTPEGWPPAFTLDQERILNLLTGDRFYSNASAALREAVLNAIDAIHRRRLVDLEVKPEIKVVFDRSNQTLCVSDNGDGMGKSRVTTLFTRIGASAATLSGGQGSVGEFGIGVISYFMAGDEFSLQTCDGESEPIGLKFAREMLAGGVAERVEPTRTSKGTTVLISLRDASTFKLLLDSFPHWCRDVEGLTADLLPEGTPIVQGSPHRPDPLPSLPIPPWVHRAHLAPISNVEGWKALSDTSRISVLYRGVFVQEFAVRGLWGIEGSIDVDPKHFRPRLNREGFIGGDFDSEVTAFLKGVHPQILEALARSLGDAFAKQEWDKWSQRQWATLWLSVPRDAAYAAASLEWDSVFRRIPAFELAVGNKWEAISFDRLVTLGPEVMVAPHSEEQQSEIVQAALRLLRHTGRPVVRGLRREREWLKHAGNYFGTTADLIASAFANDVPKMTRLAEHAETLLAEVKSLATLFAGTATVDLVRIGQDGPPLLRLSSRLIINLDHPTGRLIIEEVLTDNSGPWALVGIAARHSHEHVSQVAAALREAKLEDETLGLVKRRYIRSLLQ